MDYDLSCFQSDLNSLNISLTNQQMNQFVIYYEKLVEWNEKVNLTSITSFDEVLKKHFIDSLSFVKAFSPDFLSNNNKFFSLIDVGTGAGFPGLALKIAFPDLHVTLLDSLNKRVLFLNYLIDLLHLNNVTVFHGRAEDFAKLPKYREQFDFCVSRAVANLSTLSEYCLPFVKLNGYFVSYKSSK